MGNGDDSKGSHDTYRKDTAGVGGRRDVIGEERGHKGRVSGELGKGVGGGHIVSGVDARPNGKESGLGILLRIDYTDKSYPGCQPAEWGEHGGEPGTKRMASLGLPPGGRIHLPVCHASPSHMESGPICSLLAPVSVPHVLTGPLAHPKPVSLLLKTLSAPPRPSGYVVWVGLP